MVEKGKQKVFGRLSYIFFMMGMGGVRRGDFGAYFVFLNWWLSVYGYLEKAFHCEFGVGCKYGLFKLIDITTPCSLIGAVQCRSQTSLMIMFSPS